MEDFCRHLYDETTDGYIHIAKIDNREIKIYNTNREGIKKVVEEFDTNKDIYITPNTTFIPVRKSKNIRQFRALFIDLDTHKLGFHKSETVYMVWEKYYEGKIPKPTMVIDSGRGVHLYWRIHNAPSQAICTWQELEDYLYYQLKGLGADKQATDCVRILRLPTTINSRSNTECKVEYIDNETEYSMYDLRVQYLNYKPKETQIEFHETKKKPSGKLISNKFFSSYSLHVARAEDIETLCRLRGYKMDGYRNMVLHCFAYWKGLVIRNDEYLREEVYSLNNAFTNPLIATEVDAILRCVPKAIDKFIEYEQGIISGEVKRVSKGMRDKGGYWYKNETLIERLDITRKEQIDMKTIISKEEKYDRNNKNRRDKRRDENGLTKSQQELKKLKYKVLEIQANSDKKLSLRALEELTGFKKDKISRAIKSPY